MAQVDEIGAELRPDAWDRKKHPGANEFLPDFPEFRQRIVPLSRAGPGHRRPEGQCSEAC